MINRDITSLLQENINKFDDNLVITGMRRVGKTFVIKHLYDNLKGYKKLFLDLENPLNQSIFEDINYDNILSNLLLKSEGEGEKMYVFLDEIQNVTSIPSIVKYISDHNQVRFVMTGSASFYLKNLFTESLAGRKRIFEMFPLNYFEFLKFKEPKLHKISFTDKVDSFIYELFEKHWTEYQKYGGFPAVILQDNEKDKLGKLNDVYSSYYQNEVLKLSDFKKIDSLRKIMTLLVNRTGSKLDLTKISQELGVTRVTTAEYLEFLEQTYFISKIKPFSRNSDVSLRGREKVYICDSGILTLISGVSSGSLFENSVFNLLKTKGKVYYYQTDSGNEIDFILEDSDKKMTAFEVKNHATRKDVSRLEKLSISLGINNYYVVSQEFVDIEGVIYPFQLSS